MSLSFHALAVITAFICFFLAIVCLAASKWMLAFWGVSYSYPVGLVSRRLGAVFLGNGVLCYMARDAAISPARTAISIGIIVVTFGLASLSIGEFVTKHARAPILLASVVELMIAVAFLANLLATWQR